MNKKQAYYVYILLCDDGSFYTGITTNVMRRFGEHQAGAGGHYTRSHKPLKILYTKKLKNRSAALKREAEIKSWDRSAKIDFLSQH